MKITKILNNDMCNGPGIRTSIFVSGCTLHCEGCHNESLWDFNSGSDCSTSVLFQLADLLVQDGVERRLSILGGEPLDSRNLDGVTRLCKEIKEIYPNIEIAVWTGFLLQEKNFCDIMNYVDIVIDGRFDKDKVKGLHPWRGSSNQNIWHKNINKEWTLLSEWK